MGEGRQEDKRMRKKHTTHKFSVDDTLVITQNPRRGRVGFSKGSVVRVAAKDAQAYMCIDSEQNCFWVTENFLVKTDTIKVPGQRLP